MIDPAEEAKQFLRNPIGWHLELSGGDEYERRFVLALTMLLDRRDGQHAEERAQQARRLTELHQRVQQEARDAYELELRQAKAFANLQRLREWQNSVLEQVRACLNEIEAGA